jgi:hypothetical protein
LAVLSLKNGLHNQRVREQVLVQVLQGAADANIRFDDFWKP